MNFRAFSSRSTTGVKIGTSGKARSTAATPSGAATMHTIPDARAPAARQQVERRHRAAARGQHRVAPARRGCRRGLGQPLEILRGHRRLLVALEPDEADARRRHQLQQPGSMARPARITGHDHDIHANPVPVGRPHGCGHLHRPLRQAGQRFGAQQHADALGQRAKELWRGGGVAELDQTVVDDGMADEMQHGKSIAHGRTGKITAHHVQDRTPVCRLSRYSSSSSCAARSTLAAPTSAPQRGDTRSHSSSPTPLS